MLSIVIPTLNEEKYLPRLLESIKNQDIIDYEIIVSDGGSSDATVTIAKNFGAQVIVGSKKKHPSIQRNDGALAANGEIILFLDSDSVLPPKFLSIALNFFQNNNLVVAGFYERFNPNRWHYNLYSFIYNFICFLKQYSKCPAANGAGIMVKTAVNRKINGFDLTVLLAEDFDYCARASKIGRFRMIKGVKLLFSSRRIEKEGFWLAGWKWFRMGMFTLTNRRIKKQIMKYEFGKF